jgi:hypothetical protein
VKLLLDKGADATAKDRDGKTALDWAAASKHEVVVELLLENGADIGAFTMSVESSFPKFDKSCIFPSLFHCNPQPQYRDFYILIGVVFFFCYANVHSFY